MTEKNTAIIQLTHLDLADIIATGVFQLSNVSFDRAGLVTIEGELIDANTKSIESFYLPCNPTKFLAKLAAIQQGRSSPLICDVAPKASKKKPAVVTSADVSAPTEAAKKRRRKKHPITNELVDAEEANRVQKLLDKGGPKLLAKALKDFKESGKCEL